MLERIREGAQGPWAVGIVGLIVLSFIFTGVGSYLGGSTTDAVATVNDEEITERVLETAYQNERARMEAQFGDAISAMFANEETLADFKSNILQRLINERLVQQKAFSLGLRVGDDEIKQTIVSLPEFQLLGKFDNDTYLARLRQAGFQPTDFRDYMRNQMTSQQLSQAISGSAFTLDNEVSTILSLQNQTRSASTLDVSVENFKAGVELTDAEIQSYYDANVLRFETQEQVKLAYVSLSVEDLLNKHDASDEEAKAYYDQNISRYQTEEERRVSHILVEFGDDESTAKTKVDSILTQLKSGADFAQLAVTESTDVVSAEMGGDLDFISLGQMEANFENAAFSLAAVGDLSDVVRTDFGFHIIKLTELSSSVVTEFEEVKEEIMATLIRRKATEMFFEYQEQMAALAFEVPDTLQEVASVFNGTVFETVLFERGRLPAAVNYPQVEGIAFSSELVDEQVNSDLLEIGNERVMVVRVAEHKPQRTLALEEVKEGIVAQLTQDKAQALALTWLQDIEAKMMEGEPVEELLQEQGVSWSNKAVVARNSTELDPEVTKALFALSLKEQNNVSIVTQSNGNVALVKLDSVNVDDDITADQIQAASARFASADSRRGFENFVEALRAEAEIVVK